MKGDALWARPCIRGRTGILELEPKSPNARKAGGSLSDRPAVFD
jgi:hypothetical protein